MTTDRVPSTHRKVARAASMPVADPGRLRNSPEPQPIGWEVALRAADAMLRSRLDPAAPIGNPAGPSDPVTVDMAHDLATRLCAYDEITTAVDRMHAAVDPPLVKKR